MVGLLLPHLRILTNQTVSVNFSFAAIAQIQSDIMKSFVKSCEGPLAVGRSIEEPSTIDERSTLCNIDLRYQITNRKSNKMKERKIGANSLIFLCNTKEHTKTFTMKHTILLPFCRSCL